LNGIWKFKVDPQGIGLKEKWYLPGRLKDYEGIVVPYCWQAQFPKLREYSGWAWYQREFSMPERLKGRRIFLNVGAVNYFPEIWVNGRYVGRFDGGYVPVKVEISKYLKYGDENLLTLRVYYPDDLGLMEVPHGKQTWYCRVGGIWQDVWLEATSKAYIEDVFVIPYLKGGVASFKIALSGIDSLTRYEVNARLTSPKGEDFSKSAEVKGNEITLTLRVGEPIPWSPDSPRLYEAKVTLSSEGRPIDTLALRLGFREVKAKGRKLYLNGEPLYIKGVLVQGFYPDTVYTPPSEEWIREEIRAAKDMGFNLLRLHVKLPCPRYLELADEMGILVWEELPHVDVFTSKAERLLEETLKAMVLRDRNHPSLIIWGIVNEGWGVNPADERGRNWLIKAYRLIRKLDPTRLIVDNSPCEGNFHVITDLADYHKYVSIPGGEEKWKEFLTSLSNDPSWTFGPKSLRKGDEPALVSEFGTWGLPSLNNLFKGGKRPWWFSSSWNSNTPEGVEIRFKKYRLNEIWEDLEELTKATRRHQLESLKYMVEEIRKRTGITGYIVTQLYDLYWECNGLLNFYREAKLPVKELVKLNGDLLIVAEVGRGPNLWCGREFSTTLYLTALWAVKLGEAKLVWELDGLVGGETRVKVKRGTLVRLAALHFKVPEVREPKWATLKVSLIRRGEVAENSLKFLLVPPKYSSPKLKDNLRVAIYARAPYLRFASILKGLKRAGCEVLPSPSKLEGADLVLTTDADYGKIVEGFIREGGRVLLLITRTGPLGVRGGKICVSKRGGEWITGYHYFKEELYSPLPLDNPLGMEGSAIIPNYLMRGSGVMPSEVLAGYFEGWIWDWGASVLAIERGYGKVVLTSLNCDNYLRDPLTTVVYNNLLKALSDNL